jgi:hypothetical protein
MSPGSLGDYLAAASPQLIHISWEADLNIVGIGVSSGLKWMLILFLFNHSFGIGRPKPRYHSGCIASPAGGFCWI